MNQYYYLFLATAIVCISLFPGDTMAQEEWIVDQLLVETDDTLFFAGAQNVVTDLDNTYHMIYVGRNRAVAKPYATLYYTQKPCGGEWSQPEVVGEPGKNVDGYITLGSDGTVYVGYSEVGEPGEADHPHDASLPQFFVVAKRTEKGWETESVPMFTTGFHLDMSFAVDQSGFIHLAVFGQVNWDNLDRGCSTEKSLHDKLFEKTWLSGERFSTITGEANRAAAPRDDDDDDDDWDWSPCYNGDFEIIYANNLQGEWELQKLECAKLGPYYLGTGPSLAISEDGTAHIIYRSLGDDGDYGDPLPSYSVRYASNLFPGGHFWEHKLQETSFREDYPIAILHADNTIHYFVASTNSWEEPTYTHYFRKEGTNDWQDPILASPSNPGDGFAPSITNGVLSIAYLVRYLQIGADMWMSYYHEGQNTFYDRRLDMDDFLSEHGHPDRSSFMLDNESNIIVPFITYTYTDKVRYSLSVLRSGECDEDDQTTGIADRAHTFALRVYPNPIGSSAVLEAFTEMPSTGTLRIFSMSGEEVYRRSSLQMISGTNHIPLDLRHLNPGRYVLQLSTQDISKAINIIVQ